MAFTIVTVAEMQFMAGENVDATGDVTANHQFLHDYAASYLSSLLDYEIIANWTSLTANMKFLLTEWAARHAGMQLILYNLSSYSSIVEAEDMVSIHIFRLNEIEKILKEPGALKILGGAR